MPKLIYVFNGRLPTEKAHGVNIVKMCEAFADSGVETELLLPFRSNSIKENLFSYYGARKNFAVKKLWSIDPMAIKKFPGRLAFFIQSVTSGISIIFYLLIRRYPKDTIFYSRDYVSLFVLSLLGFKPVAEIHDYRFSRSRRFFNFIIKNSPKVIVNSEGTMELLSEHYDILKEKTLVAPNGVDIGFFDIKETREEARRLLDMPPDKIIIGHVGRLEVAGKEKGVSLLLDSFAGLDDERAVLYVVGGPDELVSKYKSQYQNTEKRVFTGQVAYKKIPLYLRAIDVVVIPMPDDQHAKTTSPVKLFEFLAAGKVIIASCLPAITSYLNDSNALFFKTGDASDLADKISLVLNEPDLREKLSVKAKTDSTQHSWLGRADKILKHCG